MRKKTKQIRDGLAILFRKDASDSGIRKAFARAFSKQ